MKGTALLIATYMAACLQGQEVRLPVGSGGFGYDSPYNRHYTPSTVITFSGVVTGRTVSPPVDGMAEAVLLLVRSSNGGTSLVDLGPAWFVNHQVAQIRVRDIVKVTGSKVILGAKPVILANQVVRANQVLALRDPSGVPYWSAFRVAAVASANPVAGADFIAGRIIRFESFVERPYADPYVVAIIDVGGVPTQVVLGPSWFIDRQDISLNIGDEVVTKTWRPSFGQRFPTFASVLTRGNDTMMLQTPMGQPVWLGWNRVGP